MGSDGSGERSRKNLVQAFIVKKHGLAVMAYAGGTTTCVVSHSLKKTEEGRGGR